MARAPGGLRYCVLIWAAISVSAGYAAQVGYGSTLLQALVDLVATNRWGGRVRAGSRRLAGPDLRISCPSGKGTAVGYQGMRVTLNFSRCGSVGVFRENPSWRRCLRRNVRVLHPAADSHILRAVVEQRATLTDPIRSSRLGRRSRLDSRMRLVFFHSLPPITRFALDAMFAYQLVKWSFSLLRPRRWNSSACRYLDSIVSTNKSSTTPTRHGKDLW